MKKIITLLLIFTIIFTVSAGHATETKQTSYIYDVESRPVLNDLLQSVEYEILTFRVADVVFDFQTNTVTFKNDQKRKDGTTDTNADDKNDTAKEGGLGTGAIIGIVAGCVVVLAGAALAVYFLVIKKKK